MKATGIVRRIDDLGRVVIPKEIRRTMRIREGDPLEIFTDREGEVILKKYSPIGELSEFASQYAETLASTTGHTICITDKDVVIAVSGVPKKDFINKKVSEDIERIMNEKKDLTISQKGGKPIPVIDSGKYVAGVVAPIISEGDILGSVVFVKENTNVEMGDVESMLAKSAAGFLGKQMEQ